MNLLAILTVFALIFDVLARGLEDEIIFRDTSKITIVIYYSNYKGVNNSLKFDLTPEYYIGRILNRTEYGYCPNHMLIIIGDRVVRELFLKKIPADERMCYYITSAFVIRSYSNRGRCYDKNIDVSHDFLNYMNEKDRKRNEEKLCSLCLSYRNLT